MLSAYFTRSGVTLGHWQLRRFTLLKNAPTSNLSLTYRTAHSRVFRSQQSPLHEGFFPLSLEHATGFYDQPHESSPHEYPDSSEHRWAVQITEQCKAIHLYRGADKSLARPTSRCILFDGENISFDASLVLYK